MFSGATFPEAGFCWCFLVLTWGPGPGAFGVVLAFGWSPGIHIFVSAFGLGFVVHVLEFASVLVFVPSEVGRMRGLILGLWDF